uniref:Uncharacterized protein n=1 Tax=Palpitomonas bilix TaxID=652834 RepID=A0A7S3CV20_9EUKA|mmetsp:Transcript_10528/g.27581  ORF Transcript_10528/g.27581 Transcript_10528/m.27581 type:complete len:226 (+) Transcript_10528:188-865(+)
MCVRMCVCTYTTSGRENISGAYICMLVCDRLCCMSWLCRAFCIPLPTWGSVDVKLNVSQQDGFGWIPPSQAGTSLPLKKPQTLRVVIGSDVDIGALCTIARGSWRDTHVHDGVKMDDQVHLGHNVHIGENTIIAAQSGVAGSTHIGKNCLIGGQVGVAQHLHIGDGVVVAARSAVTRSLPAGGMYGGSPATDIANWRREVATVRRLARQGRGEANTSSTLPSSAA